METPATDGWGEQLENLISHGSYRDAAHVHLLEAMLDNEPSASLLDVGCGAGALLRYCRDRQIPSMGIDRSPTVARFHVRETSLSVILGDGAALPIKDASCPLVTCHGMVEHLQSPTLCVRELFRITRPRGRALISVPARMSLFPLLVPIWYLTGGRYHYPWLEMVGRTYSRGSFRLLLQESGWLVESIFMFKAEAFLDWLRVPFSESVARRIGSSGIFQNVFGIMLCATCRRPEKT